MCVCVREDTHGELEGGWERKEDAAPGVSLCLFLHLTVTLCFLLGFFWLFLFVWFFFSDLVMFTAVQSV